MRGADYLAEKLVCSFVSNSSLRLLLCVPFSLQYFTLIHLNEIIYACSDLNVISFLSDCLCVYGTSQSTEPGGHFICTVYLEEKKDTTEQHVKVA